MNVIGFVLLAAGAATADGSRRVVRDHDHRTRGAPGAILSKVRGILSHAVERLLYFVVTETTLRS
jgi:hypothetical protein